MTGPLHPDDPRARSLCSILGAELENLAAVYVFGSTADGATHPRSDLDIAVLAGSAMSAADRWELQQRLSRELGHPVDLVDLRGVPTTLQSRIVSGGVRICCPDPVTAEAFENFVFVSYADLNIQRREILRQIGAEGRILAR